MFFGILPPKMVNALKAVFSLVLQVLYFLSLTIVALHGFIVGTLILLNFTVPTLLVWFGPTAYIISDIFLGVMPVVLTIWFLFAYYRQLKVMGLNPWL